MYYCFLEEDIKCLHYNDPLIIQVNYAKHIGCYCLGILSRGIIVDDNNHELNISGERVMLRSSCDNLYAGIGLLKKRGAIPIEGSAEIELITKWYTYDLTRRRICELSSDNILAGIYPENVLNIFDTTDAVFIKTQEKGFSATFYTQDILRKNQLS